jgi:hypothetical protein
MDPNNQYPSSSQGNPYEFILNPNQAPKKKGLGGALGGNKLIKTAVLIVGGVILLNDCP